MSLRRGYRELCGAHRHEWNEVERRVEEVEGELRGGDGLLVLQHGRVGALREGPEPFGTPLADFVRPGPHVRSVGRAAGRRSDVAPYFRRRLFIIGRELQLARDLPPEALVASLPDQVFLVASGQLRRNIGLPPRLPQRPLLLGGRRGPKVLEHEAAHGWHQVRRRGPARATGREVRRENVAEARERRVGVGLGAAPERRARRALLGARGALPGVDARRARAPAERRRVEEVQRREGERQRPQETREEGHCRRVRRAFFLKVLLGQRAASGGLSAPQRGLLRTSRRAYA